MRKAIENTRRKIQRFADLARGAPAAITDHVRGHGCTVFAVASINFLDHRFATIAAGKIEIDIGPAFPVFVQEPVENQIIAHLIDRRDVFSIASGKSRKSSRISRSLFKWRSAFWVSNLPAASRWVCSRMQVNTSSTSRPYGLAYCAPFVAMIDNRFPRARSTSCRL